MTRIITNIAFGEGVLAIEYLEVSDHPVLRAGSMQIPESFVQQHEQLHQDMQELLDDAEVLLESAEAAYHKTELRMREMGRT
jgi:hypothetical protein